MKKVKITPSMLAADHGDLKQSVKRVQEWGIDALHIDIMEPGAVGDIGFTPRTAAAIQECCRLPVEYHMMLSDYMMGMSLFSGLEMEELVIQYETANEEAELLKEARKHAVKVGMAFAPDTQLNGKEQSLALCDTVILMGVEPGRGGSRFQIKTLDKIRELAAIRKQLNQPQMIIAVDGGITCEDALSCIRAGADKLIIGTAIFKSPDPAGLVQQIKEGKGESDDLL